MVREPERCSWAASSGYAGAGSCGRCCCARQTQPTNPTEHRSCFRCFSPGQEPKPSFQWSTHFTRLHTHRKKLLALIFSAAINLFLPSFFLNIFLPDYLRNCKDTVRRKMTRCAQGQPAPQVSRILVCCISFKSSHPGSYVTQNTLCTFV